MFSMRGSGGLLTSISHHVLENLSLRWQRVQCFRVGNTDIPDNKRIEVALQHIHGVGHRRAHQIISELGIGNRLTKDLTGVELNSLREEVSKYLTGGDLRRCVDGDIKKLADIRSYRGFRHACMLPCRGQRTKTNARTMKEHKRRDKGHLTRSQNLAEWMEKRQERDQEK
ncbi:hypothetical protein K2173_023070 [Erythroxylum novogranatense]|uniref:Ribosomal protein S13 n=1 Tax=Erythroxylum novogranatense TaxID=1862640 RepID=A0AAV8T816_9ROSI|nr:hypothetical protein K2173_023070 [Erythroxylum novogranatense]